MTVIVPPPVLKMVIVKSLYTPCVNCEVVGGDGSTSLMGGNVMVREPVTRDSRSAEGVLSPGPMPIAQVAVPAGMDW